MEFNADELANRTNWTDSQHLHPVHPSYEDSGGGGAVGSNEAGSGALGQLDQLAFLLLNNVDTSNLTYSPTLTVLIGILTMLMCLCTIIGNVLVISAFVIEPSLRKYSNYFILNLSVADLLVGLLVPAYTPFMLYNRHWRLGRVACTVWLLVDYVVGTASVLCIVLISLDRYWLVSQGLNYVSSQNVTRAVVMIAAVWSVAFVNYGPAILFWEYVSGERTVGDGECQAEFHNNLIYLTVTASVEFFVPLISICALNLAVYLNIRQRSRGLIHGKEFTLYMNNQKKQQQQQQKQQQQQTKTKQSIDQQTLTTTTVETTKKAAVTVTLKPEQQQQQHATADRLSAMSGDTASALTASNSSVHSSSTRRKCRLRDTNSTNNNNSTKHKFRSSSKRQQQQQHGQEEEEEHQPLDSSSPISFNNTSNAMSSSPNRKSMKNKRSETQTQTQTQMSVVTAAIATAAAAAAASAPGSISAQSHRTTIMSIGSGVSAGGCGGAAGVGGIGVVGARSLVPKSVITNTRSKLSKDKKAARSLFIIVFVFVFCWVSATITTTTTTTKICLLLSIFQTWVTNGNDDHIYLNY